MKVRLVLVKASGSGELAVAIAGVRHDLYGAYGSHALHTSSNPPPKISIKM